MGRLELGGAGLLPHKGLAPLEGAAARTALAATSIAPPQEVALQQCSAGVVPAVHCRTNLCYVLACSMSGHRVFLRVFKLLPRDREGSQRMFEGKPKSTILCIHRPQGLVTKGLPKEKATEPSHFPIGRVKCPGSSRGDSFYSLIQDI